MHSFLRAEALSSALTGFQPVNSWRIFLADIVLEAVSAQAESLRFALATLRRDLCPSESFTLERLLLEDDLRIRVTASSPFPFKVRRHPRR